VFGMKDTPRSLSRSDFDRVVARAIQLDEAGQERIDLSRASEIARELGIAPDAWAAAVREFEQSPSPMAVSASARETAFRVAVAASLGFGAGLFSGMSGWDEIPFAVAMWIAAAVIAVRGARSRTASGTLAELSAMWFTLPFGIMIGAGKFLTDPLWFGALSALGSAAFATWVRFWLSRRPGTRQPDATPTT
jgi:hypothetical protein